MLKRIELKLGAKATQGVLSKGHELIRSACMILSIMNEKNSGGARWEWNEDYPESVALKVADIVASALADDPELRFYQVWPEVQRSLCDGNDRIKPEFLK